MPGGPSAIPIQLVFAVGGLLVVLVVASALTYFRSVTGSSVDSSTEEETVDVSVEVVDESTGRTYPHADRVIARRSGLSDLRRRQGVSAGTVQIELTAGEGGVRIGYGDWVFEVEQDGELIGRRRREFENGSATDHLGLPVDPHTVDVQVIAGPEREPLSGAVVEATADAGGPRSGQILRQQEKWSSVGSN